MATTTGSGYEPTYPIGAVVDAGLRQFITEFYLTSDTSGQDSSWTGFFADDATVIMGDKRAQGTDEILRLRQGMWKSITTRKHTVEKVFPAAFAPESREGSAVEGVELMLFGSVVYELTSGERQSVDWAGYARLRKGVSGDGRWKFAFYRVYLQR